MSIGLIGDVPAISVYDQPYILSPADELVPLTPLESGVSELRVRESRRGYTVGVCLPESNRLLVDTVPNGLAGEWPNLLSRPIGPATGRDADFLFYPISFDIGPDGRIFVLDPGNARIVVYDEGRSYVTEWGGWGSGEGEFNFGRGGRLAGGRGLDFNGSIAVDDEGFIYVVDELNGRIQKFAN